MTYLPAEVLKRGGLLIVKYDWFGPAAPALNLMHVASIDSPTGENRAWNSSLSSTTDGAFLPESAVLHSSPAMLNRTVSNSYTTWTFSIY
jgi:hypothetical protein